MKITVIAVGKIKEKFFSEAIAEYQKRLSRYCKLEIVQVADEKTPDKASDLQNEQIKKKEGAYQGWRLCDCTCDQRKNAQLRTALGRTRAPWKSGAEPDRDDHRRFAWTLERGARPRRL